MRIEVVNFFLVRFDGDVLFDFPPSPQANGAFQIDPRHEHKVQWAHLVQGENNQH